MNARVLVLAVVAAVLASACAGDTEPTGRPTAEVVTGATSTMIPPPGRLFRTNAVVTHVIDGDTVEVRFKGRALTVRLIGIDTPESASPEEPVECYAAEASSYTTTRLERQRVRLEFDRDRIDPFGRTLAYLWLQDELFNETLVREGYAFVTTFPPNVRYVDRFRAAQREARSADRGVWGSCVREGACDPAYPGACIPPPPPDLECSDIDERRFTVLPPDPHNFDGDGNGIGCEMD